MSNYRETVPQAAGLKCSTQQLSAAECLNSEFGQRRNGTPVDREFRLTYPCVHLLSEFEQAEAIALKLLTYCFRCEPTCEAITESFNNTMQ